MEREYVPFSLDKAKGLAREGEELVAKGMVKTEGFEKAVVFWMNLMETIWKVSNEHKNFRMELFYNAETLNTDYCFFAPTDKGVLNGRKLEIKSERGEGKDGR